MTLLGLAFCLALAPSLAAQGTLSGLMVFSANVSGDWDLYLYRAGSAPEQLTRSAIDERAPALSPDGRRLAYITSDGALWLMELPSKAARKLAARFSNGHYGYPAWMPDGRSLVYTVYTFNPPREDSDLHTHSLDTGKYTLLVNQTGSQDYPAVSPDGSQLAYMSTLATLVPGFGATMTQQIWIVSLQTGKPRQLFHGSAQDTRPAWSPDGKQIAFSSDRSGSVEIWGAAADGSSNPVPLTTGPGAKTSPVWSPDGKEIAYITNASGRSELAITAVATKAERRLQPFGTKPVEIRFPAWR